MQHFFADRSKNCPVFSLLAQTLIELLPKGVKSDIKRIIKSDRDDESIKVRELNVTTYQVIRGEEIMGIITIPIGDVSFIVSLFLEVFTNKNKEPRECACCSCRQGYCLHDNILERIENKKFQLV